MEGVDRTGGTAADEARVREAAETQRTAKAAEASGPARPSTVPPPASPTTEGVPAAAVRDAQEAAAAERARELAAASARQGDVPAAEPKPERKRGVAAVFAGLLLAMFVSTLSETVTATALPTIVGDLGGVDHMQWVTTAYILASTIMMPIYGKLGDLFGRKYLFIVALSVFIVGSATCGLAPSMDGLIAGRAVEGLGGGGLIILAQATIADIIPPRQRGKYMGVMGSVFAVSTVVGPLLGGWFVQVTGWRWLFAFNIPLALLAIAAVAFFLTNPERRDDRPPVDVGGMMAMAVSVSSLVLATAWGGTLYPWLSWQIIGLFALFVVAAVAFVLVERRAKEPIIPMLLFKNRNFVVCTITGMFIMLGMMGTVSYLPTYFQIVDGLAPEQAGLMTFPMMAGVLLTAVGTGFLATKTGRYKWMPIASCAVAAVGFVLLSRLTPDTSLLMTGVFLFILGFGIGLGQQILVLIVQNEFPHAIVGTATAANNFFRQIGSTLGASLVGALFTSRLAADLAAQLPKTDNISMNRITPQFIDHLGGPARDIITTAYSDALVPIFLYVVPLLVVGFLLMLTLKENPLAKSVNHTGHPGDDAL
ncbi:MULTISPECIES: MDR family MFS transporter [Gordonibacter]|uniref:MFS transporter n=3 Tax=Gordonibacter urolithinfaciens TaxID=1335613 RepID=A0A423UMF3_9ACTN|nr:MULTISPECIES: MDR family MFS transporter [Gordonibacter]MBS6974366.1 MFS transporter [Eggerthellaceae bacterium]GKG91776.1 MFS transporter [Gordonibacter pamelaeae]MCB6560354.1 MFS transporter [Gordonibacter urolithinfaciens]MCB7085968.1 MFS transporter [Gordonibacter urolithinfaciens]MDN4468739.1 MFS transporter [Gordonibacter sp. RACS_AR68]